MPVAVFTQSSITTLLVYQSLFLILSQIEASSLSLAIAVIQAAKSNAFIEGNGYVSPDDIKEVVYEVLRHRLILSYEAEAEDVVADDVIKQIINKIKVP